MRTKAYNLKLDNTQLGCLHAGMLILLMDNQWSRCSDLKPRILRSILRKFRTIYARWQPETVEEWLSKEITEVCLTRLTSKDKPKMCSTPFAIPLQYMPLYHWLRVLQGMHGSCDYMLRLSEDNPLWLLGYDAYLYRERNREQSSFSIEELIRRGGSIYDIVRLISTTVQYLYQDLKFNSVIYPHNWEEGEYRPVLGDV